jgi:hypothetical protein
MGNKWSTTAITGYGSADPVDDGTAVQANKVTYRSIKTNLTNPLNSSLTVALTQLNDLFSNGTAAKSGTYTSTTSDHTRTLECTSTFTLTLLAAATAGAGYQVTVKNAGSGVVTVARSASDTIDGATSVDLAAQDTKTFVVNAAGNGYVGLARTTAELRTSIGGDLVYINRFTAAGGATLDIETGIDDTLYNGYLLSVEYLYPATDAQTISMRVKVGGAYQTTNYSTLLAYQGSADSSIFGYNAVATGSWALVGASTGSNAATDAWMGNIWFPGAHSTTGYLKAHGHGSYIGSGGNSNQAWIGGRYLSTSTLQGIRFFSSSGNITGAVNLYGLRKT